MTRTVVVSLSIGTCLLMSLAIAALSTAIILGGHVAIPAASPHSAAPAPFVPKTGALGELNRLKNEIQYGPVNLDAAKEVKNGLFDRIRAVRQARLCPPCQPAPPRQPAQTHYSQPIHVTTACRFVDPSDCNYTHIVADAASVRAPLVMQPTGIEMPSVVPLATIMADPPSYSPAPANCPTCPRDPRTAVKTGSFICSNCRKSQVGKWHTDWNASGQPITFLCENCYSFMTPQQRETAYRGYIARQTKNVGTVGLLHQELGK